MSGWLLWARPSLLRPRTCRHVALTGSCLWPEVRGHVLSDDGRGRGDVDPQAGEASPRSLNRPIERHNTLARFRVGGGRAMRVNLSAVPRAAGRAAAPRGGQGRHSAGCGATVARPAAVHVIVTGIYIAGPGRYTVRGPTMCTTTLVRPSAASASAVKSSIYRRAGPGLKLRFFRLTPPRAARDYCTAGSAMTQHQCQSLLLVVYCCT
jgi:hypothetical protein